MFPLKSNADTDSKVYVDDVFSAYTYTGNGSTQVINNGIDLAGKGGMVWTKYSSYSVSHALIDTSRGRKILSSDTTTAQYSTVSPSADLVSFNSNGYTLGANEGGALNGSENTVVSWTFRNADKFFKVAIVTKVAGSNATLDLSNLGAVGMVRVKRMDASGSWYVWHRSLPAGQLLIGETSAAATAMGHITVVGTTLTLVNGVIANGAYHIECYAHDTSADGVIQCGSYSGSASAVPVDIGFEPQFAYVKGTNSETSHHLLMDSARGFISSGYDACLASNLSTDESGFNGGKYLIPTATGFIAPASASPEVNGANKTYIYLAIRRPNKPPTLGTQVYNAIARTGTGAAATITGVGFAPDLVIGRSRATSGGAGFPFIDRLRGVSVWLETTIIAAEQASGDSVTSFGMDGVVFGADNSTAQFNYSGRSNISYFFRRASGVFDEVCYTGTGVAHSEPHNLGVVPELMIVKRRGLDADWPVYIKPLGNKNTAFLNANAAATSNNETHWNQTDPTASVFSLGTPTNVNASGTYVAYLFATKAGISKVGSFTGNGSSQTINCGFTTGARFVLIKRTDYTGDWFVWDSVRGIVAGNDPHLSLNTTAAEVTTDDSVDTDTSGFIANQVTATNINVNSGTYIFLAFA